MASLRAEPGVTHLAAAFDTVIESFRNDLYPGYKTGALVAPELAQVCDELGMATLPLPS
jgi:5'-3' exonuclease